MPHRAVYAWHDKKKKKHCGPSAITRAHSPGRRLSRCIPPQRIGSHRCWSCFLLLRFFLLLLFFASLLLRLRRIPRLHGVPLKLRSLYLLSSSTVCLHYQCRRNNNWASISAAAIKRDSAAPHSQQLEQGAIENRKERDSRVNNRPKEFKFVNHALGQNGGSRSDSIPAVEKGRRKRPD